MAVQAAPPTLPPFLYLDYSFQVYLNPNPSFDWNRTLVLTPGGFGGQYYQSAIPLGGFANNIQVQRTGPFDWEMTIIGNAGFGPVTLFYLRGGPNPVGAYNWVVGAVPFPYPQPNLIGAATVNLLTTSPIQISTASPLPDAASMTAYSQFIVASGAVSTPAFTIIAGALPGGLGLNGATGEISGSATQLGVFNVTIRATDSVGHSDKAFQLTVNSGLVISTSTPLPKGIINQPYSRFLAVTNNLGAVTWTVQAGALPTGMNLVGGTGEITGTPTVAGVAGFTIRATDTIGFVDKIFSLEILAAIPAQVQVTGTLNVPTGFTCIFGGGVTLDVTTQAVPLNVTLNQFSPTHYDDGTGSFTMDLVGGLWAITSIGGIFNGPPLGIAPFAPFPVNLQNGGNCAGASQGLFDVDDTPGLINLVGLHPILHLVSYSDVSLPTPLQTDNYSSGTLDVQAV